MSLEVIKTQMRQFLASKEPEVLAVRGDWGVGKTFTWDQTLNEAQALKQSGEDPNAIGLNYYAYVSLFGISSLQDLRTEIAFNKLNTIDLKHAEGVKKFQQASGKFLPKIVTQALKYAGISAGTLVDTMFASMSNSMIRNTIVCIDDFERCDIPEKETLGFINDLKCKRGCKVVLLLNDKVTNDFKSYREKVIDYDLEFKINPNETEKLLRKDAEDDELISLVFDNCRKLKVTNLRIIIKTLNLLSQARNHHNLENYSIDVQLQFIKTLTLANYCFYGHDPDAPTIEFLTDIETRHSTRISRLMSEKNRTTEVSEEESLKEKKYKRWERFLESYDYSTTDKFDEEIINSVISGYIDKEDFSSIAKITEELFNEQLASQDIQDAIDSFYTSLMDEAQEETFSKHLKNCIIENIENARPKDINNAYVILKRLNRKSLTSEFIDLYIKIYKNSPKHFSFEGYPRGYDWDIDLYPIMKRAYEDAIKIKPPKDTFNDLLRKKDPIPSELDIKSLEHLTHIQIEELIRSKSNNEFRHTVKLLLLLNSHDTRLNHIYDSTIKVLHIIASESEQKRMLVEHYGVMIGDPPSQ
ncbi:hypothetical protein [Marinobacter sp. W-8]|uniref:hypothetical protein n=1 Tax=Marinobacter sp. W-8 TaxID=3369658 RepID=UPI0037C973E8